VTGEPGLPQGLRRRTRPVRPLITSPKLADPAPGPRPAPELARYDHIHAERSGLRGPVTCRGPRGAALGVPAGALGRDLTAVIGARIRYHTGSLIPRPALPWSAQVPGIAGPACRAYATQIAALADARKDRIGQHAATHALAWAVTALGPVPETRQPGRTGSAAPPRSAPGGDSRRIRRSGAGWCASVVSALLTGRVFGRAWRRRIGPGPCGCWGAGRLRRPARPTRRRRTGRGPAGRSGCR